MHAGMVGVLRYILMKVGVPDMAFVIEARELRSADTSIVTDIRIVHVFIFSYTPYFHIVE
jgi:hypothetical protein